MPAVDVQSRIEEAFSANRPICTRCQLGFREYWSTLAMMRETNMPIAGAPVGDYAFAVPPAVTARVPMCRSGLPVCEGMRGVLKIKFGELAGARIARDLAPVVLQ